MAPDAKVAVIGVVLTRTVREITGVPIGPGTYEMAVMTGYRFVTAGGTWNCT